MLADYILAIRNQFKLNNVDVDQHWALLYDQTINKLYQAFFSPGYNHFWTLETPQDIENQRLHNKTTDQSASIGDIANALLTACSNTDFATTSDERFLCEFERFFLAKTHVVEAPMPYSYT